MEGFEKVSEFLYSPCPSNFSGGTGITGADNITVIPDQPYVLPEQNIPYMYSTCTMYSHYIFKSASIVPVETKKGVFLGRF
jgi:hypothetical protein